MCPHSTARPTSLKAAVHHDAGAGTLRVGLGRTAGAVAGRGRGSVVELVWRIRAGAQPGRAVVNLRRSVDGTFTQLNDGGLDLNPDPSNEEGDRLDGTLTVRGRAARQRLARDLAFAAGPEQVSGLRSDGVSEFFRAALEASAARRNRRPG